MPEQLHTEYFVFVQIKLTSWVYKRYYMDGSGIEPRGGGASFSPPARPAVGPTYPTLRWVPAFFAGSTAAGARR
jgi:hypothetical protein